MRNRKLEIRNSFESNLIKGFTNIKKHLFDLIEDKKQYAGYIDNLAPTSPEESMIKNLLLFTFKTIIVFTLFYFVSLKLVNDIIESSFETVSSQKMMLHDFVATSVRDGGVFFALIEASRKPELSNSLAKYYERIGDAKTAITMAKLTIQMNESVTKAELDEESKALLIKITGADKNSK